MPRKSIKAVCKVCGAKATFRNYSSRGSNGKEYFYERYTHGNGTVHYFRAGRRAARTDTNDAFERMIETRMTERSYRFRDIKKMFESTYGLSTNNTTISRSIVRAVKFNLLEKKTRNNDTLYIKRDLSDTVSETRIRETTLTYSISEGLVNVTLFLYFENGSDKLLTGLPIGLPSGRGESKEELDLSAFDSVGKIPESRLQTMYSYPGQIGLSIGFNRPLRPKERGFILLLGGFETREEYVKFTLPLNTDSFRIHLISGRRMQVHVRKRLLDGVKESNPDSVKRGILEGEKMYTDLQFENALKGESIVVSWRYV